LGGCALFLPVVLVLVAYDLRWIALAMRAGQLPPWGAFARLFAAACCHGGVILLVMHGADWPPEKLTFWMHMTLDPGLTFYSLGLYELYRRVATKA
jgi:hypothetical protein